MQTSFGVFLHISSIIADPIFRGFQEITADEKISIFYFLYCSLFQLKFESRKSKNWKEFTFIKTAYCLFKSTFKQSTHGWEAEHCFFVNIRGDTFWGNLSSRWEVSSHSCVL